MCTENSIAITTYSISCRLVGSRTFRPSHKELWKLMGAKAKAVIEDGKLVRVEAIEAGAGYSTPPKVTVKGFEMAELVVTPQFDWDLKKNGGIKSINLNGQGGK